eukprot:TRINITY_DN33980_c1_g1_i1.p1 TRINITY_DN33980_c1_g1~~TRINITY_DN33980_c1_g1_i1.p1  ORF type:complete len:1538 (-),score=413.03 TRINITY_DN33980_c1_g1_i1:70-4683(-)
MDFERLLVKASRNARDGHHDGHTGAGFWKARQRPQRLKLETLPPSPSGAHASCPSLLPPLSEAGGPSVRVSPSGGAAGGAASSSASGDAARVSRASQKHGGPHLMGALIRNSASVPQLANQETPSRAVASLQGLLRDDAGQHPAQKARPRQRPRVAMERLPPVGGETPSTSSKSPTSNGKGRQTALQDRRKQQMLLDNQCKQMQSIQERLAVLNKLRGAVRADLAAAAAMESEVLASMPAMVTGSKSKKPRRERPGEAFRKGKIIKKGHAAMPSIGQQQSPFSEPTVVEDAAGEVVLEIELPAVHEDKDSSGWEVACEESDHVDEEALLGHLDSPETQSQPCSPSSALQEGSEEADEELIEEDIQDEAQAEDVGALQPLEEVEEQLAADEQDVYPPAPHAKQSPPMPASSEEQRSPQKQHGFAVADASTTLETSANVSSMPAQDSTMQHDADADISAWNRCIEFMQTYQARATWSCGDEVNVRKQPRHRPNLRPVPAAPHLEAEELQRHATEAKACLATAALSPLRSAKCEERAAHAASEQLPEAQESRAADVAGRQASHEVRAQEWMAAAEEEEQRQLMRHGVSLRPLSDEEEEMATSEHAANDEASRVSRSSTPLSQKLEALDGAVGDGIKKFMTAEDRQALDELDALIAAASDNVAADPAKKQEAVVVAGSPSAEAAAAIPAEQTLPDEWTAEYIADSAPATTADMKAVVLPPDDADAAAAGFSTNAAATDSPVGAGALVDPEAPLPSAANAVTTYLSSAAYTSFATGTEAMISESLSSIASEHSESEGEAPSLPERGEDESDERQEESAAASQQPAERAGNATTAPEVADLSVGVCMNNAAASPEECAAIAVAAPALAPAVAPTEETTIHVSSLVDRQLSPEQGEAKSLAHEAPQRSEKEQCNDAAEEEEAGAAAGQAGRRPAADLPAAAVVPLKRLESHLGLAVVLFSPSNKTGRPGRLHLDRASGALSVTAMQKAPGGGASGSPSSSNSSVTLSLLKGLLRGHAACEALWGGAGFGLDAAATADCFLALVPQDAEPIGLKLNSLIVCDAVWAVLCEVRGVEDSHLPGRQPQESSDERRRSCEAAAPSVASEATVWLLQPQPEPQPVATTGASEVPLESAPVGEEAGGADAKGSSSSVDEAKTKHALLPLPLESRSHRVPDRDPSRIASKETEEASASALPLPSASSGGVRSYSLYQSADPAEFEEVQRCLLTKVASSALLEQMEEGGSGGSSPTMRDDDDDAVRGEEVADGTAMDEECQKQPVVVSTIRFEGLVAAGGDCRVLEERPLRSMPLSPTSMPDQAYLLRADDVIRIAEDFHAESYAGRLELLRGGMVGVVQDLFNGEALVSFEELGAQIWIRPPDFWRTEKLHSAETSAVVSPAYVKNSPRMLDDADSFALGLGGGLEALDGVNFGGSGNGPLAGQMASSISEVLTMHGMPEECAPPSAQRASTVCGVTGGFSCVSWGNTQQLGFLQQQERGRERDTEDAGDACPLVPAEEELGEEEEGQAGEVEFEIDDEEILSDYDLEEQWC